MVIFDPTAEIKKVEKTGRPAEETPKQPLAAGRTAGKNWFLITFKTVILLNEFFVFCFSNLEHQEVHKTKARMKI